MYETHNNRHPQTPRMAWSARLLLAALLLLGSIGSRAEEQTAKADSIDRTLASDYVTVSLLSIDRGTGFVSFLGHNVLRMQCPSQQLDYCFSFETGGGLKGILHLLAGQAQAGFIAVSTEQFLNQYSQEGRGTRAYTLNLTPQEEKTLWSLLDKQVQAGPTFTYDIASINCASACAMMVQQALDHRCIVQTLNSPIKGLTLREAAWQILPRSPWYRLMMNILQGSRCDEAADPESVLPDSLLAQQWQHAWLVGSDGKRHRLITDSAVTLLPTAHVDAPKPVTPAMVGGALFTLAVLAAIVQWRRGDNAFSRWTGSTLFAAYTLWGLLMVALSYGSANTFIRANMLVLFINPLPFLLWLAVRRNKWCKTLWQLTTVIAIVAVIVSIVRPCTSAFFPTTFAALAVVSATAALRQQVKNKQPYNISSFKERKEQHV